MDIVSELGINDLLSKQYVGKAHVGTAHELIRAATLAGGNALGRPDLGRIEAGAKADLLVFDLHKPHLQPVWDPVKNLVWKGNGGDMAFAMVHGKPVVRDGRLLTMDEDKVMRIAAGAARKIWKVAESRGILPPMPA